MTLPRGAAFERPAPLCFCLTPQVYLWIGRGLRVSQRPGGVGVATDAERLDRVDVREGLLARRAIGAIPCWRRSSVSWTRGVRGV